VLNLQASQTNGFGPLDLSGNGQDATARLLARDDKNDLVLLATDLHPTQTANWRLQARQGEDIVVYGFPLTGVLASGGNVAAGNVTALAGLADESRFLQISAPFNRRIAAARFLIGAAPLLASWLPSSTRWRLHR
jgi:S1-C subfamily serine protease